jgi:hypothetical protein
MPHTQIAPLERLLHCCQYTHGDEHIEEAFQILWQYPHLIRTRPFDSISRLNPIAKAAISRFRATTRALDQASFRRTHFGDPEWLPDALVSGQCHPNFVLNLIRWEVLGAPRCEETHLQNLLLVVKSHYPRCLGSAAFLSIIADLRGKFKLSADFEQFLNQLVSVSPLLTARRSSRP